MHSTVRGVSRWFVLATLAVSALIAIGPLLWLLSTSLKQSSDVFATPPQLIPPHPTLSNYEHVWTASNVPKYFANSITISLGTVILNLGVGTLLGYALARIRFRGRGFLFGAVVATMVVPFPSVMLPLFVLVSRSGLENSRLAVVIPTAAVTLWLSTYMLKNAFEGIPLELEEAALLDGCSPQRMFLTVMLPLVKAPMAAAAIFIFTLTWSDFLWPLVALRDPNKFTVAVGVQYFLSTLTTNWHHIAAVAVLASIPTVVLFLLAQRFMTSGVLGGAVRG